MRSSHLFLMASIAMGCSSSSPPGRPNEAVVGSGSGSAGSASGSGSPSNAGAKAAPTVAELAAEKDVLYLDVRSPAEFAVGHVDGAVNIPVGDTAAMVKLIGRTDRPVIVHCAVGGRAAQAVSALKAEGFSRLVNGGGFKAVAEATGKAVVQ